MSEQAECAGSGRAVNFTPAETEVGFVPLRDGVTYGFCRECGREVAAEAVSAAPKEGFFLHAERHANVRAG